MLADCTTLAAELAPLQLVEAREIERRLDEGRFHRGAAAVSQLVMRQPHEEVAAEEAQGSGESAPCLLPEFDAAGLSEAEAGQRGFAVALDSVFHEAEAPPHRT